MPGRAPAPADAVGLRYFSVNLPDQKTLDVLSARLANTGIPANQTDYGLLGHDPSENGVILTVSA